MNSKEIVEMNSLDTIEVIRSVLLQHISIIPNIIAGFIIFVIFYLVARLVYTIITNVLYDEERKDLCRLIAKIAKYCILVFGIITSLGTMGLDVTGLVAGLGLSSFAIGLALKDAVSNSLYGMLILIYRPFKSGDQIEITGITGLVEKVDLRYTTIDIGNNSKKLIPNSMAFTNVVSVINQNS